ncbi:hypothetical protein SLEP1_g47143 [Rubroshorea leprosula]|uniref:Uncharacterized protein n=1 Tax=Rubroshorea leprosula TaxID=152421 RepID=A0AAV5LPJ8_9ROSI|nr:hypothetical protein SLEP1_g47143 [Rubroshorea leprosula]
MAADAILGTLLKLTLSKVISATNEQLNLAVGFHQELRRFHVTLGMTWGVLDDAEQKQVTGRPDLKHWLEELWSISEEADDLMDEIAYENLRRKVVSQKMLKQVSYFFTPLNPLAFRLKMGIKIKNLNAALVDLNNRATGLGLQHRLANRNPEPRGIQQTVSLLGEPSRVIGRDGDVQKIVELLIHDSSNQQPLCVVSIVGIAGLGKTTLAKLMLESLTKAGCENITSQDVVVQKIKENLEGKKYLLVLDDVWNEDRLKWEDLRQCLLGISKTIGSKVLVTTRTQNVASMMGTAPAHVHRLEQLKDNDCWSIIKHRLFGNSELEELENIGKEIAKKCKGVPLIASVIGGTLCNNRRKDDWLSIKDNIEVWGSLEEANGVQRVLQLSFERLPELALKQCFAFCSILPKNFIIEREVLIQLWMAEGFLQPFNERYTEIEDIGDKCLKYLSLCGCDGLEFFPRLDGLSSLQCLSIEDCGGLTSLPISLFSCTALEKLTITQCNNLMTISSIDGLSFLREIYISYCWQLKSIGESLSSCPCLKKLTIEDCPSLMSIPSLFALFSLEALSIKRCIGLTSLPSGLFTCISLEKLTITECHSLISIPEDLKELHSLVELEISRCGGLLEIPEECLGCLTSLKQLCIGGFSKELEEFPNLGFIQHVHTSLRQLTLVGWETLKRLPRQIQCLIALHRLFIEDFDGLEALPNWFGNLSSLQNLSINDCNSLKQMEAIRCLCKLHSLRISRCPELKERCARGSGSEWDYISHIPNIDIDRLSIQLKGAPVQH